MRKTQAMCPCPSVEPFGRLGKEFWACAKLAKDAILGLRDRGISIRTATLKNYQSLVARQSTLTLTHWLEARVSSSSLHQFSLDLITASGVCSLYHEPLNDTHPPGLTEGLANQVECEPRFAL